MELTYLEASISASRRVALPSDDAAAGKIVAEMRDQGDSWAQVMVRTGTGETRVRNVFSKFTGLRAEGLRIGKGGRWLGDEARYYEGNRRQFGVEIGTHEPRRPDPGSVDPEAPSTLKQRLGGKRSS